jgi:hypothetical protein
LFCFNTVSSAELKTTSRFEDYWFFLKPIIALCQCADLRIRASDSDSLNPEPDPDFLVNLDPDL